MTEIRLTPSATGAELVRAGNVMSWRYMGRLRNVVSVTAIIAGGMLFALVGGAIVSAPVNYSLLIGLYGALGALLASFAVQMLNGRRLAADFNGTDWRRKDVVMVLDPGGVSMEARRLPWADVSGVARVRENTMLLFSAVDGIMIPDRDLPDGVTPVDFQRQIANWWAGKA